MTLEDLRAQFRLEATDEVAPYLFASASIDGWLTEAVEEACLRARLIYEDESAAVCQTAVTVGNAVHPLHASVVEVAKAYYIVTGQTAHIDLCLIDREEMSRVRPDWREMDNDEPCYLIVDDTKVRLVPAPSEAGTLHIEAYRIPIERMESDDDVPEIAGSHHRHLVHWALHRAFNIPDTETVDPGRAAKAESEFTRVFGLRPDADQRKATQANRPHFNKLMPII